MLTELKKEFKLLKRFYIFYFIWGLCSFIGGYWIIYFRDIGLSYPQISTMLAVSLLAPIIFEIPTGAFADHFGRRASIALGLITIGLLYFTVPFAPNYLVLLLIFFGFMSLATFISGTPSAWMVDFLKSKKKDKLIKSAFARTMSLVAAGAFFAFIASAFIVKEYGLTPLWYLQGIALLSVGIYVILFGEKEATFRKGKFRDALRNSVGYAKAGFHLIKTERNLLLFVISIFFTSFFMIGGLVWQPFITELGLPVYMLGFVFAGAALINVIVPNLHNKAAKFFGSEKWMVVGEYIVDGALFALLYIITSPWIAIAFFYISMIGNGVVSPFWRSYIHPYTPSKIRATTSSIINFIFGIGGIMAFLIGGFIAQNIGLHATFLVGALLASPGIITLALIKDKKTKGVKKS